ncbi:HAD family hydrolase [Pelobacter seleniigenes]|uniref:HAD family hydrolase n=1 Tax=Pelobacter seleniigenes TaxID=407188 RepID=UPI0004A73C96|nr:HAD family phosphatase [Pelobacter seleniigenes]
MKNLKAVIFDCDGVMFESRSANLAFYNKILARFAYPPVTLDDQERAHFCHTASSPVVLKGLLHPEHLEGALAYAAQLDYREFIPWMTPESGLRTLLAGLKDVYPLAVATNRGGSIETILSHFQLLEYFSTIVTSADVARPKPAPDMLLLAAEKLAVAPEDCLFIGDSELDMAAAHAANMNFAGYGPLAGGEVRIGSHQELLELLLTKSGV